MIALELPWPHKHLSPNARVHWAQKAKAVKAARLQVMRLCDWSRQVELRGMFKPDIGPRVAYTFYPKDRRRRDLDNLIASTKGWSDELAHIIGIDDSKFRLSYELGPVCKEAYVIVTVST